MIPMKLDTLQHQAMVQEHLCSLQASDRHLRFGGAMSDYSIEHYVAHTWEGANEWLGVVEGDRVIAAIHIAFESETKAELGLSVDPKWRGKKLGQALFERAIVFLKAKQVQEVYMHCLTENAVMRHIAHKNEMHMESCYGETDADLVLKDATPLDKYQEVLIENLAQYDNNMRSARNAWRQFIGLRK
jgi:RimJ/RimL family protein N-acetyltransferase